MEASKPGDLGKGWHNDDNAVHPTTQILVASFQPAILTRARDRTIELPQVSNTALAVLTWKQGPYPAKVKTPAKTCKPVYSPFHFVSRAPPIGFPTSDATEIMAKRVPERTPIWRTSEIWAMRDGVRETKLWPGHQQLRDRTREFGGRLMTYAPLPKPYKAAKTMMGALVVDGIHMASTRMLVKLWWRPWSQQWIEKLIRGLVRLTNT